MKQSTDYKKLSVFKLIVFFALLVLPMLFLHAQTADELKNKIDQKSSEIEKLEKDIASFQSQLNTLGKQKSTLAGSIKELDLTKKKLNADISVTQNKIDKKNLEIQGLSSDISVHETNIDNNREVISTQLRSIDEYERSGLTETILSTEKDFTNIWNDIDNMLSLREQITDHIADLKKSKGELEDTREVSIEAKNELTALRSKLSDQKKIIEQNTAEKNKLLKQTQNSESTYQKLLVDQTAKKNALEKELRDYESQLKYILDPKTLPGGGVLAWPLDSVFVTQMFGKTVDAKRLYASGSHSGVDFRASVGTPVKAMADGVVTGTGNTDLTCAGASFGQWVLIDYGDGLASTFGHLSLIKVSKGQRVSRGEVVAYSGSTGHVTGPHLHVTIYAADAVKVDTIPSKSCPGKNLTQPFAAVNAYLDPMTYLPPYKI